MAMTTAAARQLQTRSDPGWRQAWSCFDAQVQGLLTAGGLGTPLAWAHAFVDDPPDEWEQAAVDYAEGLCGPLPGDGWVSVSKELHDLASASMRATASHGKRVAAVSDLQLSVDAVDKTRLRAAETEESDLKRMQVYNPDGDLPVAWRPVKYRR